jgi:hypothetical protein
MFKACNIQDVCTVCVCNNQLLLAFDSNVLTCVAAESQVHPADRLRDVLLLPQQGLDAGALQQRLAGGYVAHAVGHLGRHDRVLRAVPLLPDGEQRTAVVPVWYRVSYFV